MYVYADVHMLVAKCSKCKNFQLQHNLHLLFKSIFIHHLLTTYSRKTSIVEFSFLFMFLINPYMLKYFTYAQGGEIHLQF